MNKINSNRFYVTTAIDYASGAPHIGHAYEKVAADVIARWNRNIGQEVFFQTGTDEHGQKIVANAKDANLSEQKFVDERTFEFISLCKKLEISYDYFIRTTDEKHKKIVQDVLQRVFESGDIYKGNYEGLYCVGCEKYYTEDELVDGKCPDHKKEPIMMREDAYFFKLSNYQEKLLNFYQNNPEFISPKSKAKEIINRVKDGLRDVCISRSKESLSWGIELPFDKSHVTYVWFDALFNYYSGALINKKEEFWPCNVHIIGHDISWFHTVYWPAFLMSAKLELPKKVFSHGMILDGDGHKMSKSLGNVIDPILFVNKYGISEFRYFVMSQGTFGEDISFSLEKFSEKVNNELNNDFGNLISRVHAMSGKYFDGTLQKISNLTDDDYELLEKLNFYDKFNFEMQELRFNFALEILWNAIRETNAYVNKTAPWKEESKDRLGTILNLLASASVLFAKYINCFMPEKSDKIFKQFNLANDGIFKLEFFQAGHRLAEKENLFVKVELEKKIEQKKESISQIKKQGFSSLNLKVGKIIEVKQHPGADKLFIEKIDVGESEPRVIVSGLKGYYELDELLGRNVIVVANLKPAKLRGEMSQGMVLACENADGSVVGLLSSDAKVGANVSCANEIANNEDIILIDDFVKVQMISDGKYVFFENKELRVNDKIVSIHRDVIGKIR